MKNIIQEETEEENKRVVNNYWKIRSFLNSKIVWDMQFHVIARTPIEEQEECLNFIKENEDNIKKNGLYVPFIDQDISIEEFGLSTYEMERKLNYGNNKYGKKIVRNRDRGIR